MRARCCKKKNLRLMRKLGPVQTKDDQIIRSVVGGVLVQGRDMSPETDIESKIVTARKPTPAELSAMLFAWKVVKHVKSNAIACRERPHARHRRRPDVARGFQPHRDLEGKGRRPLAQGQRSRQRRIFPFPDGLIAAAEAGATCAIQPGGSVKDPEVIAAANERNMAMICTGCGISGTEEVLSSQCSVFAGIAFSEN